MFIAASGNHAKSRRTTMLETTNQGDREEIEIGDDLGIMRTTRRAAGAGTWVCGRLNGHRFDALVFSEHAENPDFELGESWISKLWVQRRADRTEVANFDPGWDVRPTTNEAAAIVDFLAAGLADHIFNA
jgi:hypothetical protein